MNEVFAMAQKQLNDFFRRATFADLPQGEVCIPEDKLHRGLTRLAADPETDGAHKAQADRM